MQNGRHLRALLAIDLRRAWPGSRTIGLVTVGAVGLLVLFGKTSVVNVLVVVLGAGLGMATAGPPMTVMRDKIDGSLEFLCTLPTSARMIAAAKFLTSAVTVLPWSLGTAIIIAVMGVPHGFPMSAPAAALSGFFVIWVTYCLVAWCLIVVWARFEPERVGLFPLLVLLAALFGAEPLLQWVGLNDPASTVELLRAFIRQPWLRVAAPLLIAAAVGGLSALSFVLTAHAFANYRPKPAEPH